ncbi:MAG: prepilin-type cleavage/methylation domain-containing protein [Xanthomonadales bacterium]|nr:prepilin-type cleavage/methylation domain-containing protein [Xanthomonadales bacterium]
MNKQQGFTLIELMIVVAIIGILAAIAIPAYQDYIARSQVAEASTLIGGARTAIEEEVAQTGVFPSDRAALSNLGVRMGGQYVSTLDVANVATSTGEITATFKETGVSAGISTDVLAFQRTANGEWVCLAGGSTTLDDKYQPKPCE